MSESASSSAAAGVATQSLDEASVHALYTSQIEPQLVAFETERRAAMGKFWMRMLLGGAAAVLLGAVVGGFIDAGWGFGAFMVLAVLAGAWAYGPLGEVAKRAKIAVLNAIAGALSIRYALSGFSPPAFPKFRELSLLPAYDRMSTEDLFEGTRSNTDFALYDAHLEKQSRDSKGRTTWTTVFRGSLIRLGFPKEFLGTTVVRRDAGIFNMFRENRELKRIGLGASSFEKIFEVYGTDQVEARFLVHPVFMEKLIALEKAFRGGKIRCAFTGGDLLIAVEGRDRFEIGNMFSNLVDKARVERMAGDVTTVMSLVDTVLAGPPPAYRAEIEAAREQLEAEAAAQNPVVEGGPSTTPNAPIVS